jgi:hypothetical protein
MPHAFGVFRFAVFVALALGRAAMTAALGTAVVGGPAGPRRRATLDLPRSRWAASVLDLLDAIDAYVPVPERYVDAPFLMAVENSLTITGRGTVVTRPPAAAQLVTGPARILPGARRGPR